MPSSFQRESTVLTVVQCSILTSIIRLFLDLLPIIPRESRYILSTSPDLVDKIYLVYNICSNQSNPDPGMLYTWYITLTFSQERPPRPERAQSHRGPELSGMRCTGSSLIAACRSPAWTPALGYAPCSPECVCVCVCACVHVCVCVCVIVCVCTCMYKCVEKIMVKGHAI